MTAEQVLKAARIIRDVAANCVWGGQQYGYYPLAEALEEYAEKLTLTTEVVVSEGNMET